MNLPTDTNTIKALHEFTMGVTGGNEIEINILNSYPLGSLGKLLYQHYLNYPSIPHPNDKNGFPARYILAHDLHHLLIDSSPNDQGEAEVMAFECGLLASRKSELSILPFISQLLESFSHKKDLNFIKIASMFDVGFIDYNPDPYSLPTMLLIWSDGLKVELKTEELGKVSPFIHCKTCKIRKDCREGIFALRLTHTGRLQLCMDRTDLSMPLSEILNEGYSSALEEWFSFIRQSIV